MKIGSMNNPEEDVLLEIKRIAEQNFDFIDLTYEWPGVNYAKKGEVKKLLDKYGLGIIGHTNPTLPAAYPSKKVMDACWEDLKDAFNFFSYIGAKKVSIHPFYYTAHLNEKDLLHENIKILNKSLEYCCKIGIELMIENCFSPFGSAREIETIFKAVPGIKIHLDVGHMNLLDDFETEIEVFLNKFSNEIAHCHIHDNNGDDDSHLSLGCGTINWERFASLLKRSGYDGTFTLEVFCSDCEYLIFSKNKWERLWSG